MASNNDKQRNPRLLYCTAVDYPSMLANSVQQIKTAHAMARIGSFVRFFIKNSKDTPTDPQTIFAYYDLKEHPNFTLEGVTTVRGIYKYAIYLIKLFFICLKEIATKKVDVVLSREPRVILMSYLMTLWTGTTLVFEAHDLPDKGLSYRAVNRRTQIFHRYALRVADVIVTVTNICKQEMAMLGINPDRILVAPDAADLVNYSKPRQQLAENGPVKLAYVGSLGAEKGCDLLVRALAYIPSNMNIQTFIVGGNRGQIEVLEELAENICVIDRINFIGNIPHGEVKAWIESSDILIMPTARSLFGERYTSPMKLFEYMASQRPIVVSDLPTVREILDDESATFFEASDHEDLARAIKDVIENWPEALVKAQRAYKLFVENFTFENRARRILSFIEKTRGQ